MSAKDIAPYKGKRRKLLDTLASADNADDGVGVICRKVGLSTKTYYKYLDEPEFRDALKRCVDRAYARYAPQIATSVVKQAKKGNVRAADLIHKVLGLVETGNRQSVNVAVHKDTPPTTLQIDTPEQLEQAIAHCQAEMITLQELMTNLIAMRTGTGRLRGDGIHPGSETPPDEEG